VIIFAQLYLTIISGIAGQKYQFLFLAFYLVKLNQFFHKSCLVMNMAQSNMVCLILAVLSVPTLCADFSVMAAISSALFIVDAYIGLFTFAMENKLDIAEYLQFNEQIIKSIRRPLIDEEEIVEMPQAIYNRL